jgi:hypothetical protein
MGATQTLFDDAKEPENARRAFSILIEHVINNETITYADLNTAINKNGNRANKMLGIIGRYINDYNQRKGYAPFPNRFVISQSSGDSGDGVGEYTNHEDAAKDRAIAHGFKNWDLVLIDFIANCSISSVADSEKQHIRKIGQ